MTAQNKEKLVRWLPHASSLLIWSTSVIALVAGLSAERANFRSEQEQQKVVSADHETRLRGVEKQVSDIAADVRWIRQSLEKKAAGNPGGH